MDNKKVSVIIPCYNHAIYVKQTLDSVLNDSYPEKEIVIIDDGSSDNSVEVIKNWISENSNKINIIFKYRENKGITATLNELKSLATGKYIAIMASDDYLIENSIAKRMDVLLKTPEKKLIFGDAHVVDENNNLVIESSIEGFHHGNKKSLTSDEGILKAALFNPVFSGALVIMDREVYDIIGDYPENLLVEDWFFWQRVALNKLAVYFDGYVSCYRRHGENLTADESKSYEIIKNIVKTCQLNLNLVEDKKTRTAFKKFIFRHKLSVYKYELKKRMGIKNILKYFLSKGYKFNSFGINTYIKNPLLLINPRLITIGNNVRILDNARIEVLSSAKQLMLGNNINIEQGVHITCGNKIKIGNNCSITPYVTITDISHEYKDIKIPVREQELSFKETVIGNDCFIGTGAVILPGVHLGKHCVVGANSVVTNSFPSFSVIAGNPARLIKKFDPKTKQWIKVEE